MRAERTGAILVERAAKDELHVQFARIGRALADPHRVELLDLLAQGERNVEVVAARADISVGSLSAPSRYQRGICRSLTSERSGGSVSRPRATSARWSA